MNLERLFQIYQEEAGDDGSQGGGSLLDGAPGNQGGEDDKGGEPGDSGEWFLAEGIKGEGDRPEYYKADKYKSLADQARAYTDLEKKLGAFTGAPEEYELTLPEGTSELIEINPENEQVQEFMAYAKEAGISQEAMSKMVGFHVAAMQEAVGDLIPNKEAEMAALGKNAISRINNVVDWAKANLDQEQFDQMRAVTTTADGIMLVEALIGMTKNVGAVDTDTASNQSQYSPESLREMRYKKDEKTGEFLINIDPEYKKKVDQAYRDFYGAAPKKETVTL